MKKVRFFALIIAFLLPLAVMSQKKSTEERKIDPSSTVAEQEKAVPSSKVDQADKQKNKQRKKGTTFYSVKGGSLGK